jgi:hypothetical protein
MRERYGSFPFTGILVFSGMRIIAAAADDEAKR